MNNPNRQMIFFDPVTRCHASCTFPPPACLTPDPRNSGVTVNGVTVHTWCSVFVVNTVNFICLFLSATARILLAWLFDVSAPVVVFRSTTFLWMFPLASRHLQTFFAWRVNFDFCITNFAFSCRCSRILKSPVQPRQRQYVRKRSSTVFDLSWIICGSRRSRLFNFNSSIIRLIGNLCSW